MSPGEGDVPPLVRVRRLTAEDAGEACALLAVFADAFALPDEEPSAAPNEGDLRGVLARESLVVLAAEAGAGAGAEVVGEVVGGLVAHVLPSLARGGSELHLYDLAVAAPHLRRGVATALIRSLQEIAAGLGAGIYVQADRGDEPALALYARFGSRRDVCHFDIEAGPPPTIRTP